MAFILPPGIGPRSGWNVAVAAGRRPDERWRIVVNIEHRQLQPRPRLRRRETERQDGQEGEERQPSPHKRSGDEEPA